MSKTHEFYPMITATIKSLLDLFDEEDYSEVLQLIISYPKCTIDETCPPLLQALRKELDRQYTRWNKGGAK